MVVLQRRRVLTCYTPVAAGEKSIASIQSSVAAAALDSIDSTPHSAKQTTGTNSSDANTGSVLPPSLGACLLAGCGVGALSKDQAEEVLRQWLHAVRSGADRGGCLSTLAARWQQPPGLKPLSRTRQAGLDRLRGCVQLASAAAVVGLPMEQIVMVSVQPICSVVGADEHNGF